MPEPSKDRVFDTLREVAELLDNVTPKEREQIMTMLYARYEMKVVKVSALSKSNYKRPTHKPHR